MDALVMQRPLPPSYQELIEFLCRLGSWVFKHPEHGEGTVPDWVERVVQ